jgi:hypothetical protein
MGCRSGSKVLTSSVSFIEPARRPDSDPLVTQSPAVGVSRHVQPDRWGLHSMMVQRNPDLLDALNLAEALGLVCEEQRSRWGFFPNCNL